MTTPQGPAAAEERTDEDWMAALRAGQMAALDVLMQRWQVRLRSFLFRHLHDVEEAMDLAQETFVRVHRHRERYRPGARFSTWLFQIALNLARDHARRRHRRPTVSLEAEHEPAAAGNPRSASLETERTRAIAAAIQALPEHLREVLLLSEYEEKSHTEIALIVGATPKAVETRLHRARTLLRTALRRWLAHA